MRTVAGQLVVIQGSSEPVNVQVIPMLDIRTATVQGTTEVADSHLEQMPTMI